MNFTVISAVNNEQIVRQCLLSSPDIQSRNVEEVLLQRGFDTAADAYNEARAKANGDILVFLHQDVYLPPGWFQKVRAAIDRLGLTDPHWGVLGIYGVNLNDVPSGYLYCNANQGILGQPVREAIEVKTLDEVILITRKDSGLKFDDKLRGFHLYGADICLMAQQQGFRNYVIPGFCIHNANGYGLFPRSFWQGYFYIWRKWKSVLPVKTPCVEIKHSIWPILRSTIWRFCWLKAKRIKLAKRVEDPAKLYSLLDIKFTEEPLIILKG